jgi:oxepin-CoA hydrolase/3-oxo-5,6-dehydrosuberyl-CoA semialdehyde dehydrogenase
MKMAVGEIEAKLQIPEAHVEKYQDSLYNFRKTPKNFEHPDFAKGKTETLVHADFNTAKEAFLKSYDTFEAFFKENPEAVTMNSMFGPLNKEMWDLINRKHFNHHLEQFGLL